MTKHATSQKVERGYFAAKSVVSKKGAAMRVTKLELTASASKQLKADSQGISTGTTKQASPEVAATNLTG
jgi:hypothetical protein